MVTCTIFFPRIIRIFLRKSGLKPGCVLYTETSDINIFIWFLLEWYICLSFAYMVITLCRMFNTKQSLRCLKTQSTRIFYNLDEYFLWSKLKIEWKIEQKYLRIRGAYYTLKYGYFDILRAKVGVRFKIASWDFGEKIFNYFFANENSSKHNTLRLLKQQQKQR